MHFEILVEGQSELTALSIIMSKIVGEYNQPHTWKIHKHRGVGKLSTDLNGSINKDDRTLLYNFPSKLRAYGKSMSDNEVVVILVDLDNREDCVSFKSELLSILDQCERKPNLLVRIAIEELEAWFLGDQVAVINSFPNCKIQQIESYTQDSQCGTWEVLGKVINDPKFKNLLSDNKRSRLVLEEKVKWAKKIAPNMNVDENMSPSFICFRNGLRKYLR